jgi:hypothetical protein
MSIPAQVNIEPCASCGRSGVGTLATEFDNVILCENCINLLRAGKAISYVGPAEPEATPPPEERFSELFKAARALLQESIEDENVIYPTLALANAIGYDLDLASLKAQIVSQWDRSASQGALQGLVRRCNGGLRPVGRGEEGSLVVASVPAAAWVEHYRGTQIPEQVDIRMFPHRAPNGTRSEVYAADCAVASYQEAVAAADIRHDNDSGQGPVDSYFESGVLHVTIRHREWPLDQPSHAPIVFSIRMPVFPHPDLVRNLCLAYLKGPNSSGFLRFLKPRGSGRSSDFGNLIPGCVATLLRDDGDLQWPAVRQLLNQQKIFESVRGPFPEDELERGYEQYHSRRKALEKSTKKARQRLTLIAASIFHNPL